MPYCEGSDEVQLYYEDFGDGPAFVFTSAGLLTHKMWEGQVAGLNGRFRTITYDWRGTGASAKPRSGYTGEAAAADLCALVERLKVGPATLVGHGIGTHVTLLAAIARPDLVKAIVLASGGPWFCGNRDGIAGGLSDEYMEFMAKRAGLDDDRGIPYAQALSDLGERWLYHRIPSLPVQLSVLEQALTWPQVVHNAFLENMKGIDHRTRLNLIACAALIIHGRHDRKQRYQGAEYLAKHIPNARLVTLEDSAHMGQMEEINAFNRALAEFAGARLRV